MDGLVLVMVATIAVLGGSVVFFVWAAQYFGRRVYRQMTRRLLYVPVEAQVTGVLHHSRSATLFVVYDFRGTEIVNRFLTSHDAARLAAQTKHVSLLIDPDYPKDVLVAPAFEKQASAPAKPAG